MAFVAAVSVVLLAYNATVFVVPAYPIVYVPLNLALAAALLAWARRAGLGRADVGLAPGTAGGGLRWGLAVTAAFGAAVALAVAVPALHPLLDDERIAGIGADLLAYRALVRIPFGTALLEEVAFRGVLFGAWSRAQGEVRAAVGSSAVFGLWHVRPALELVDANAPEAGLLLRAAAVAGAVVFTGAAGLFLCWLRTRSASLVAPFTAHAGVNSLATVAAYAAR